LQIKSEFLLKFSVEWFCTAEAVEI